MCNQNIGNSIGIIWKTNKVIEVEERISFKSLVVTVLEIDSKSELWTVPFREQPCNHAAQAHHWQLVGWLDGPIGSHINTTTSQAVRCCLLTLHSSPVNALLCSTLHCWSFHLFLRPPSITDWLKRIRQIVDSTNLDIRLGCCEVTMREKKENGGQWRRCGERGQRKREGGGEGGEGRERTNE